MALTFDDRSPTPAWPFWRNLRKDPQGKNPQDKSPYDLGAMFSAIPHLIDGRLIDGHLDAVATDSTAGVAAPHTPASGAQLVQHFADYVTAYLSLAHGATYVATLYEPAFGRLHADRAWEEPHYRMVWEPVDPGARPTCYALAVGARDLCFSAAVTPGTRQARLALKATLAAKADLIKDRMWENSLRFLPGSDDARWRAWNAHTGSWEAWGALGHEKAPERFGVMFEAGPIVTPVATDTVSFHISESIRRVRAVLDLV